MGMRGYNTIYDRAVEIPTNLAENQEHGVAIDTLCHDHTNQITKKPRSHQILRVAHQEQTGMGSIHYSVRHHPLLPPDKTKVHKLTALMRGPDIRFEKGRIEANTLFPEIMYEMNPNSFKGFYLGLWDPSITYDIHYDNDLSISRREFRSTSSMMTELMTPQESVSRIKHDPFNQNIGIWCDVMGNYIGKPAVRAETSTMITTNLINRYMFEQALENEIPGIYRYKPSDTMIATDKEGYAYRNMSSYIPQEALETAIFPCTKCDSFVGAINIASLANFKKSGPGIFSNSLTKTTEDPQTFKENNETMDNFLDTAAFYMTQVYKKNIIMAINLRQKR